MREALYDANLLRTYYTVKHGWTAPLLDQIPGNTRPQRKQVSV
jgi:hypothetical protein